MPRAGKPTKQRHDPLHVDLEGDEAFRRHGKMKSGKRRTQVEEEEEAGVSDSAIPRPRCEQIAPQP